MLPLETEHWANTHPPSSGRTELFQEELLVLGWFETLPPNIKYRKYHPWKSWCSIESVDFGVNMEVFILGAESLEPWNHLKPRVLFLAFEDPNYPWFSHSLNIFEWSTYVKLPRRIERWLLEREQHMANITTSFAGQSTQQIPWQAACPPPMLGLSWNWKCPPCAFILSWQIWGRLNGKIIYKTWKIMIKHGKTW